MTLFWNWSGKKLIYAILREQPVNQMFIWAAGLALSRRWGCLLKPITTRFGRTATYMYLRIFPVRAEFLSPSPGLLSRKPLQRELYSLANWWGGVVEVAGAKTFCCKSCYHSQLRLR